jgi:hypothetical protein
MFMSMSVAGRVGGREEEANGKKTSVSNLSLEHSNSARWRINGG